MLHKSKKYSCGRFPYRSISALFSWSYDVEACDETCLASPVNNVRSCNIFISSVHFAWFPTASNSDRNVNMSSKFGLNGCNLTLNGKELFCSLEFNCLEIWFLSLSTAIFSNSTLSLSLSSAIFSLSNSSSICTVSVFFFLVVHFYFLVRSHIPELIRVEVSMCFFLNCIRKCS